jgi:signal transduction histidine kinase
VSLDVRTTVPVVEVDRHRMRDVFRNLVGNALKYSPGDTPVDVVCEDACGRVVVRVVDRGIGVPRESLPRVFDRFYRAPNIGDLTVLGSGLGLTIAREMVEAHGGEILAESDGEGHGSTFTVVLPVESMGAGVRA